MKLTLGVASQTRAEQLGLEFFGGAHVDRMHEAVGPTTKKGRMMK